MKKLFLYIVLFSGSFCGYSQTDNYGTEFWTAFMQNESKVKTGDSIQFRLYISARENSDVTISMPLCGYSKKITVPKDSVKIFLLPIYLAWITGSEIVKKSGIHIVSNNPISVILMNQLNTTTDATVVFPLKNIPTATRYVTGHPGILSRTNRNQFLLVSPENGVNVEITPTAVTTGGKKAFSKFNITLDEGETYMVQSGKLLDGSVIKVTNNKKIIVYSGDICSNWPSGACDHEVEQVLPDILLDTTYYALPQWGHAKGYVVKVLSIDSTIWVKVNGKPFRIGSKDSALIIDVPSGDSVLHISGPRNFECFQFLKGAGANGYNPGTWGDPSMLQLITAKYMSKKSVFSNVNSKNLKDHFVSILIPTSAKKEVFIDGANISSGSFSEVSFNRSFSYAKIKLNTGVHYIECDKGHIAYCAGVGAYESYLYSAAFSLPSFTLTYADTFVSFDCKNNKVNMHFTTNSLGNKRNYLWDFGDGTYDTAQSVHHSFLINKEFNVKLYSWETIGKRDSVIKKFIYKLPVFNPLKDTTLCHKNITFTEKNPYFINFKWNDSSKLNTYTCIKTEKVWVSATDTSGNCLFSDTANVFKNTLPVIEINDTIQCNGINNFILSPDSAANIKSYSWKLNNSLISNTKQTEIINLNVSGMYKVALNVINNFNCTDSTIRWIEVLPPFRADFSIENDTQCFANHSFDFINTSSPSKDKIKSFVYKENNVTIGITDSIINFKFSGIGSKTIQLKIETENGCKDSITHGVYLIENPSAGFISDSVCLGEPITLTAIQTRGMPLIQWTWNMDDGSRFDPITANFTTHTYKDAGTYLPVVSYEDRYGCYGSFAGNPVLIYPLPIANFSIKVLASDDQFSFVKLIPKNLGYLSYLWCFPDGTNNPQDTPTIKFSRYFKDSIRLKVKSLYGCSNSASQFIYIFPALTNIYFENAFTPNGDQLNELFRPYNVIGAENYELRIYDRWGEQLFITNNPQTGWNGTYKNEPVQLGVYIFTVEFAYPDGNRYSTRGNVTVIR